MKTCAKCQTSKDITAFTRKASAYDGLSAYCRDCQRQRRQDRKATRAAKRPVRTGPVILNPVASAVPVTSAATDYVPSDELIGTFAAAQLLIRRGRPAPNMLFVGPSGSGKTEGARHLAALAGVDLVKVDAPSMVDPESWFGTREVVVEDGAPKTIVTDSAFVAALGRPCVLLIDEVNRVSDAVRNILLPLLDDSRAVTNPLTGQPVVRHPECLVIMTGNVGLAFTGTYAVDPALLTRALTTTFDYLAPEQERAVASSRTGASEDATAIVVRFADETRTRARQSEDFPPVSTREVIAICELVSVGLDLNTAVRQVVINAASNEGGGDSVRAALEMLWTGISPAN